MHGAFENDARCRPVITFAFIQTTWGTSPDMVVDIEDCMPDPLTETEPARRTGMEQALACIGLFLMTRIVDIRPDKVFIGSCINACIENLRQAGHGVERFEKRIEALPAVTPWPIVKSLMRQSRKPWTARKSRRNGACRVARG